MKTIKCSSLYLSAACCLVLLWNGCASTPTRESTGQYIDDSTITAKVKAEYARDPVVQATQVNVETFKGVVQLSGFVDDNEAKQRAEQLAKRVGGVARVEDNIIVKPVNTASGGNVSSEMKEYSGKVTAINPDDNSLTVKQALISHTFKLATGADVLTEDNSHAHIGDLHVGDNVKVTYSEENGVMTATRIERTAQS